jgi:hypothetical protein
MARGIISGMCRGRGCQSSFGVGSSCSDHTEGISWPNRMPRATAICKGRWAPGRMSGDWGCQAGGVTLALLFPLHLQSPIEGLLQWMWFHLRLWSLPLPVLYSLWSIIVIKRRKKNLTSIKKKKTKPGADTRWGLGTTGSLGRVSWFNSWLCMSGSKGKKNKLATCSKELYSEWAGTEKVP